MNYGNVEDSKTSPGETKGGTELPSLEFILRQETGRFFETSVGITVPILPFNSDLIIEFESQAFVNQDDSQDIRSMQTEDLE